MKKIVENVWEEKRKYSREKKIVEKEEKKYRAKRKYGKIDGTISEGNLKK